MYRLKRAKTAPGRLHLAHQPSTDHSGAGPPGTRRQTPDLSRQWLPLPPPAPRDRLPGPHAVYTDPPEDLYQAPLLTDNHFSRSHNLEPRRNPDDPSQPVSGAVVLNAADSAEYNAGTATPGTTRAGQHRRPSVPAACPDPPGAVSRPRRPFRRPHFHSLDNCPISYVPLSTTTRPGRWTTVRF